MPATRPMPPASAAAMEAAAIAEPPSRETGAMAAESAT